MYAAATSMTLTSMRVPVVTMRTAGWEAAFLGGKPNEIAPDYLDGSLPGDSGCDPLALAALAVPVGVKYVSRPNGGVLDRVLPFAPTVEARKLDMSQRSPEEVKLTLNWMREAELKHARLAMLAVIGWPLAELLNPFNALAFINGRAPSLFNGGLDAYAPFLLLAVAAAGFIELQTIDDVNQTYLSQPKKTYIPGNLDFDPVGLQEKMSFTDQAANEIYNGRIAMLAITGFAVQEFVWGSPVVDLPISSFFFGR